MAIAVQLYSDRLGCEDTPLGNQHRAFPGGPSVYLVKSTGYLMLVIIRRHSWTCSTHKTLGGRDANSVANNFRPDGGEAENDKAERT